MDTDVDREWLIKAYQVWRQGSEDSYISFITQRLVILIDITEHNHYKSGYEKLLMEKRESSEKFGKLFDQTLFNAGNTKLIKPLIFFHNMIQ